MSGKSRELYKLESFGDVAAEDDAVLEYFLSTNAVEKIEKGKAFLVLGRKGTGKTAIVRYFTERQGGALAKALNLRGYPWNVHAQRVDRGASDIEAYVSSWRYLIAAQLGALALSQPKSLSNPKASSLVRFYKDNYGGIEPRLTDILRPNKLRLSKFSLKPSIMGNQLGGVDLDRESKSHQLGLELNALSTSIMDTVLEVAQYAELGPLSLHFDELDQGMSTLDDSRSRMLIGLVIAAREIRRDSEKIGGKINPVIYLRSDLWEEIKFSDKNKISQGLTLHLEWEDSGLKELVEERLRAKLSQNARWDHIAASDLVRGSQTKWNHILARTFLRPRDVISFLNSSLNQAKTRDPKARNIINEDIVNSRDEYSSYLKKELDDEITPHWPYWDDALKACSAISTLTFERENFVEEYRRRRTAKNDVTPEEALRLLYRFSVVGYEKRSGYGGSSWAFQYTSPEAGWDNAATRFKVHLGLKEYAKLRETRQ